MRDQGQNLCWLVLHNAEDLIKYLPLVSEVHSDEISVYGMAPPDKLHHVVGRAAAAGAGQACTASAHSDTLFARHTTIPPTYAH
jgi:hypothetical protein